MEVLTTKFAEGYGIFIVNLPPSCTLEYKKKPQVTSYMTIRVWNVKFNFTIDSTIFAFLGKES